jgi:hypothetical protein
MELTAHNETKRTNNIKVFHQNICSITNKLDELHIDLQTNPTRPHLICLTDHHLKETKITKFSLDGCKLISSFCREESQGGGVCILISNNIIAQTIDLKNSAMRKYLKYVQLNYISKR